MMFKRIYARFILSFLILAFLTPSSSLQADTVQVPVRLSFPFLRHLLILEVFNQPGHTAEISLDPDGCTKVVLSEPVLSGLDHSLRLDAEFHAVLGMGSEAGCIRLTQWDGRAEVLALPKVVPGSPRVIFFEIKNSNLYDRQGALLSSGVVWDSFKESLNSSIGRFRIDFTQPLEELKTLLPTFLPRHSKAQMERIIDSLKLTGIQVGPDHVTVDVSMEVEKLPATVREEEPLLTADELERWEGQYDSWDAFFTFVIKQMAAATELAPLRSALLEILLDARYEFRNALANRTLSGADPVRELFLRSWERLVPVMEDIGATMPEQEALALVTFVTAGDALQVLDRLGPAVGLEISADGLRRLARLINDNPHMDPLRYTDEEDPELRRLFGFEPFEEDKTDSKPLKLNFLFTSPAFAEILPRETLKRLNQWVPDRTELDQYLPLIRRLLDHEADTLLKSVRLSPDAASVFRKLVLAAAWQESCWRQYIAEKRKIVPLRSNSGDIGLMQVNERIWRGFYAVHKLKWDISYNAWAGSEILMKYLVNYAIPKGEHRHGSSHYLARAVYSAYNGGPGQLGRYRDPKAPAGHKKIDTAFWRKYQAVQRGKEYDVAECLGGTLQAKGSDSSRNEKKAPEKYPRAGPSDASPKTPGPAGLKQQSWIMAQNPKHFTLQIAALSTEQSLQDFIGKHRNLAPLACYRFKRDNKLIYAVIYGTFAQRAEAENTGKRLGFDSPWVRDFKSLQEIIKKQ